MQHAALSGFPGWLLAALCATVGAYCLFRVRTGPRAERAEMTSDAVMGFGMAAMAPPSLMAVMPGWSGTAGVACFAAAGLAASASPPARQRLHHALGALAMVYMSVTMPMGAAGPGTAHAGHTAETGVPVLTAVLLAYFGGYVLFAGAALATAGPADASGAAHPGVLLGRACRIVMAVAMLTMLAAL
ncbi:DUF5134 domain-containing protein [Streptomyces sp. NPDC060275]|uniref:DUF5134 domain-containing protein n=1 Tax=Streptomyces sp. NPDC060275 TaxID=3347090 RepID=UPI00365A24C3